MGKIDDGTKMSHDVFVDIPDTLFGRVLAWYFKTIRKGEQAVYAHTFKELAYFKTQLESGHEKPMLVEKRSA